VGRHSSWNPGQDRCTVGAGAPGLGRNEFERRSRLSGMPLDCANLHFMLPIRHVARVILIDAAGCTLLCRYTELRSGNLASFWVPPGGALELGEDHHRAALREVREETGLIVELGLELWERRFTMSIAAGPVDQIERYFLVQLSSKTLSVSNASGDKPCPRTTSSVRQESGGRSQHGRVEGS
jgi:8-oxo-dGTP pyrophosphatase MutT (NUDIX family)